MVSKYAKVLISLLLAIVVCTIICFMNDLKFFFSPQATIEQTTVLNATETIMLKKLTNDDLQLIKKQKSFSWDDFCIYESKDIGSGLFVLRYDIADGGYLLVSGPSLEQEPKKIIHHHSNGEEEIIYQTTY